MSAKKFVVYITIALYIIFIANLILWHVYTKKMFLDRDLNRIGSIITAEAATKEAQYVGHHTEYYEGMKGFFDIITVGDSFTNGQGGSYYQDYFEEKYNLRVLNVPIDDIYTFIQSGILNDIQARVVIFESVERSVQRRLGRIERFNAMAMNLKNRRLDIRELSSKFLAPIIFKANVNFISDAIIKKFDDEKVSINVYKSELDREFFTNRGQENLLLYYFADLHYLKSKIDVDVINKNLNNAAKFFKDRGIQFIFFVAPDKYDLFYPYIIDKRGRAENNFFVEMQKVSPKNYTYIDARAILRKALERGEKDIYWLNDTHWSWKGAELVCDDIVKNLRLF